MNENIFGFIFYMVIENPREGPSQVLPVNLFFHKRKVQMRSIALYNAKDIYS
jgi:hypothetical protein